MSALPSDLLLWKAATRDSEPLASTLLAIGGLAHDIAGGEEDEGFEVMMWPLMAAHWAMFGIGHTQGDSPTSYLPACAGARGGVHRGGCGADDDRHAYLS